MYYDYLEKVAEIIHEMLDDSQMCLNIELINTALNRCREEGGTIYIIGNGGSSSTASHFASDLLKTASKKKEYPPFRAICPTDNVASLTAWSNDNGFIDMFARYLNPRLTPRDILIILSSSGNSENLVRAAKIAKLRNSTIISICGSGGKILDMSNIGIGVPTIDIMKVEDIHLILEHSIVSDLNE